MRELCTECRQRPRGADGHSGLGGPEQVRRADGVTVLARRCGHCRQAWSRRSEGDGYVWTMVGEPASAE